MIMGIDGFVWWQGVVEDRHDPLKLGRVRVRMLALDSESKNIDKNRGIPTENLLWAYPMQPITSAAMNGIGETPLGVVEGTWVFGFFRDGRTGQDPVVIGTVGGIPQDAADPSKGFNDPNGVYPKSDHLGEPDTNRLARNENIDKTVIETKNNSLDSATTRLGSWSEPASPYAAEYPFNHVKESESGHIHEVDDTPGAERLHTYHRSGSFEEIHPDGTKVTKVIGDDYEIVIQDKNALIKGNLNITVIGNADVKVSGNADILVEQETTLESIGHVQVIAPTVNVGDIAIEPAVLGNKYKSQLDHLIEVFNNHDHIGNLGSPTSNPVIQGHVQQWMEARSDTVKVQA